MGRRGWRLRPPARMIERLGRGLDELGQLLLEDPAHGVLVLDQTEQVVVANGRLRAMLGREADLLPGRPGLAIFTEDTRAGVGAALGATRADGRQRLGLVARLAREEEGEVALALQPVREADGSVSGTVLRLSDRAALRRLEARLAQGEKLQAVGQLAGGIAHDFNNFLTAVLGGADAIRGRAGVDPETAEDAAQIRASAERGAALVRQLLAFSRQQALQPRPVAVNQAIGDLSALLPRLLGSRVDLRLDLEKPGRMVWVDPVQLDQVLMNLAVNARHAMPSGGTLTLRTSHLTRLRQEAEGGAEEQEQVPPGRYVVIEVEDTGTGIPPEVLPRIFEPFFTTRREQGGTGLGLATVHGIVRQAGGFLSVASKAGRGTRFRILLPLHADAAPRFGRRCEGAPLPPPLAPSGRTILLVEDEEPVRRLASRALAQHGWRVRAAESGEAALAMAEGEDLALLVSDVVMPGMDGPALLRRLRQARPGLPALLVSGYAEEGLRRELGDGGLVFLPKPYALKDLLAKVEALAAPARERVGV